MNAQDQARVDRDSEEVFTIENDILSPRQQIRLHFRCLVQEHKFGKLGWHLKGIRRALFLSDFADRNIQVPRTFSVPLDSNTPSRFLRQLSGIYKPVGEQPEARGVRVLESVKRARGRSLVE
jgi:hypothetical protein